METSPDFLNDLISFWQRCPTGKPPFTHPDDLRVLQKKGKTDVDERSMNFDSYLTDQRFGRFDDRRLHSSLLPVPYLGDLANAKIVILLLNPGLSYTDYWGEAKMSTFRRRLVDNLGQSFNGVEFPFLGLDPQFCWWGGFVWWEKKLRDVATIIADKKFYGKYFDALRDLSTKLACVELIPYHSSSFSSHAILEQLPSSKMIRKFVLESLIPDSQAGKRTLIVTRQIKAWKLPKQNDNIVVYEGGHTRGASLSQNSSGGKAILKSYGIG
jgi:hypothetical protein